MGVCTTIYVTRTAARAALLLYLETADGDALGEMMDPLLRPRLYNCIVVPDGTEPNDDAKVVP